jgi:hypothetical protein
MKTFLWVMVGLSVVLLFLQISLTFLVASPNKSVPGHLPGSQEGIG